MDFILLAYIHFHFKLEYPFVCGDEQLLNLAIISYLIKKGNGFYVNPDKTENELYKAIVDSYIHTLMKHNCLLEVFLE
jgi:glycerol-3-phosphate O-acyltransferase